MHQHVIDGDLTGVLHAHGHHGKTVADQDDLHASSVGCEGAGKVMRRQDGDGLILLVQRADGTKSDLFPLGTRGYSHGRM